MKIALIGYGNMGKAVEKIAQERGHSVATIIDKDSQEGEELSNCDVVIDFSLGEAIDENIKKCAEAKLPLVIGSTGWYDKMSEIQSACEGIPAIWSSNFSIGVNLFFRILEESSKMIDKFDEYDIWAHEIHHKNKADSPSGTAKVAADILLKNIKRKNTLVDEKIDRKIEDNELHFSSVRGGLVNFAHTIGFDSAADRITITHEARCRDGYALGAVKAAEWLITQSPGFYSMEDFLNI